MSNYTIEKNLDGSAIRYAEVADYDSMIRAAADFAGVSERTMRQRIKAGPALTSGSEVSSASASYGVWVYEVRA